jgi:hypothetical protein
MTVPSELTDLPLPHCKPMRARKSPELFQDAVNAGTLKVVMVPGPEFVQTDQLRPAAVP